MLRFMSLHWSKLSALGILYCVLAAGLGYLTNMQLDAMQDQANALQLTHSLNTLE
ncbi:hypothetical protein [Parathermosynechococcus lividus]